jgi:hypothetical protein
MRHSSDSCWLRGLDLDFATYSTHGGSKPASELPPRSRDQIGDLLSTFGSASSDGIIARDADILECLIQAREYQALGISAADEFARTLPERLRTKAAKSLAALALRVDPNEWWKQLRSARPESGGNQQ